MDTKNDYIPQEIVDNLDPEAGIDCQWVLDSETGDRVLVDRKTNKEIGRWLRK